MNILFAVEYLDWINPIGLMQLSAMAKDKGHKTDLVILSKEDVNQKIEEYQADVVAFNTSTGEHNKYARIVEDIKSKHKEVFVIMGGMHPTFFPKYLEETQVDAICVGEGEYAFVEVLENLEKDQDISNIQNIIVRNGKDNGMRDLIQDLDSLPFPDRDLIYSKIEETPKIMNFIAMRGCPYPCTYCFHHAYRRVYKGKGNYLRYWSVDYVIKQIKETKEKYDFNFIRFNDDIFNLKPAGWLEEFAERYPKEIGIPFYCHSRFDLMTENVAKLLKKAGCQVVQMSVESANIRIRNEVIKRGGLMGTGDGGNDRIIETARYCAEQGINILIYNMLGLPTSTIQDDIDTVDFNVMLQRKFGNIVSEFPIFQPFPKTDLYEMSVNEGWFDEKGMQDLTMYNTIYPSLLNCFTEEEKNIQMNISLLGPSAVQHPILSKFIMNKLIYKKCNKYFEQVCTLRRMFQYPKKVYRRDYSLQERLDLLKRGLKMEGLRRSQKEIFKKRPAYIKKIFGRSQKTSVGQ